MKSNRNRSIGLRLTSHEYACLQAKWKATTCRKLSDYLRRSLLDKALVCTYRNLSQDQAVEELVQLRKELNALGNNFNQLVKKLHTLHQIPDMKTCILSYEIERLTLQNKVDQISLTVKKMLELWLP